MKSRACHVASFFLLFAFLASACSTLESGSNTRGRPPSDKGGVATYLAASEHMPADVSFTLAELAIFDSTQWIELAAGPQHVSSAAIGKGQQLLGFYFLPPGTYTRMRFAVQNGRLTEASGVTPLQGQMFIHELALEAPLTIEPGGRHCLLLNWQVKPSVQENTLRPSMTLASSPLPTTRELLYISCPSLDAVFVVRMDNNHVVSCFPVRGRPTWLDVDTASQTIYVLAAEARQLLGFSVYGHQVLSRLNLTGLPAPQFWALSSDGQWAYVVDANNYLLQKIDAHSGFVDRQIALVNRPGRIGYFELEGVGRFPRPLLALSMPDSRLVTLLDPETLDFLEPASLSPTMARSDVGISTGLNPTAQLFQQDKLYICDSGANTVTIFDLAEGRAAGRVAVGNRPQELLEGRTDRVYVSVAGSSSIATLVPGQLSPINEIYLGLRPAVMAKHARRSFLYAAAPDAETVVVLDLNSSRILSKIPLPAPPFSLATLE